MPIDIKYFFVNFFYTVCRLLESGIHAIFGPSDSHLASHIVSICESVSMPLLLTIADRVTDLNRRHFVTDMFPAREHLGQAFRDLINFLNWTKIAIVYDDEEGKENLSCSIVDTERVGDERRSRIDYMDVIAIPRQNVVEKECYVSIVVLY